MALSAEDKWLVGYGHPTFKDFYAYVPAGTSLGVERPTIETFGNEADAKARMLEINPDYEFEPPTEEQYDSLDAMK